MSEVALHLTSPKIILPKKSDDLLTLLASSKCEIFSLFLLITNNCVFLLFCTFVLAAKFR